MRFHYIPQIHLSLCLSNPIYLLPVIPSTGQSDVPLTFQVIQLMWQAKPLWREGAVV